MLLSGDNIVLPLPHLKKGGGRNPLKSLLKKKKLPENHKSESETVISGKNASEVTYNVNVSILHYVQGLWRVSNPRGGNEKGVKGQGRNTSKNLGLGK